MQKSVKDVAGNPNLLLKCVFAIIDLFYLMGSCLSSQQLDKRQQRSSVSRMQDEHLQKKKSLASVTTNPQELSRKESEQSPAKRDEVGSSPDKKHVRLIETVTSFAEMLEDEDAEGRNEQQMHNFESRGQRNSRPKGRESRNQMMDQLLSQMGNEQTIDIRMSSSKVEAKLHIKLENIDFQFILPKCRAGPLVTPQINYTLYQV